MRVNKIGTGTCLVRTVPGTTTRRRVLQELRPEVVLGDSCRRAPTLGDGGVEDRAATAEGIVNAMVASCTKAAAHRVQSGPRFASVGDQSQAQVAGSRIRHGTCNDSRHAGWSPFHQTAVFLVGARGAADIIEAEKMKETLERGAVPCPTLGEWLGKTGTYYLSRAKGEKSIYSFCEPLPTPMKATVKQGRPEAEDYQRHHWNAGSFEEASTLNREG